jgi:hypothetical protein
MRYTLPLATRTHGQIQVTRREETYLNQLLVTVFNNFMDLTVYALSPGNKVS